MLTTSCIVSPISCVSPVFALFAADGAYKEKKRKKYESIVKHNIPKRLTLFHAIILYAIAFLVQV